VTTQQTTRDQLNAAIKGLAKLDRSQAVAILAEFDVLTTAKLPAEHWPAVIEACEAAVNKFIASTP
jgi:hypothetical protein